MLNYQKVIHAKAVGRPRKDRQKNVGYHTLIRKLFLIDRLIICLKIRAAYVKVLYLYCASFNKEVT